MHFIPDIEINLDDKSKDLLKTKFYTDTLKEIITSSGSESLNIGLVGEWGSGKSSIIKTLRTELTKNAGNDYGMAIYDAWKYSNDSFRRMFLITLKDQLGLKETKHFKSFYEAQNRDIAIFQKPAIAWMFSLLVIIPVLYFFGVSDSFWKLAGLTILTALPLLGPLVAYFSKIFPDLKLSNSLPVLFAPEKFEECYEELVAECLGKKQERHKWFKKQYNPRKKLIIVIDNLDRCHKEMAYELLTVLKTFLSDQKNVIFIVPYDENGLQRHFKSQAEDANIDAGEFLRKLFDILIRIKPLKRFDLFDFILDLNRRYKLSFQPTTIDMIAKQYAKNPRRVIQFCNNLIAELQTFSVRFQPFVTEHQAVICKALIIREEWPVIYALMCNNPELLVNIIDHSNAYPAVAGNAQSFLISTEAVGKNTSFEVLDKILTIADTNQRVPLEIAEAIDQCDMVYIEKKYSTGKDVGPLVDDAIELLNQAISRQTWQTGVSHIFVFFCALNEKYPLSISDNERVKDEVKNRLINFLFFIKNVDTLCKYAFELTKQQIPYLKQEIFHNLLATITVKEKIDNFRLCRELFSAYLRYSSNEDTEKNEQFFSFDKRTNGVSIADYKFDKIALANLFTEDYFYRAFYLLGDFNMSEEVMQEIEYVVVEYLLPDAVYKRVFLEIKAKDDSAWGLKITECDWLQRLLSKSPSFQDKDVIVALKILIDHVFSEPSLIHLLKDETSASVLAQVIVFASLRSGDAVDVQTSMQRLSQNGKNDSAIIGAIVSAYNQEQYLNNGLISCMLNAHPKDIWQDGSAVFRYIYFQAGVLNAGISNYLIEGNIKGLLLFNLSNFVSIPALQSQSISIKEGRIENISSNIFKAEWLNILIAASRNEYSHASFISAIKQIDKGLVRFIPLALLPGASDAFLKADIGMLQYSFFDAKKAAIGHEMQYADMITKAIKGYLSLEFYSVGLELFASYNGIEQKELNDLKILFDQAQDLSVKEAANYISQMLAMQNKKIEDQARLIIENSWYGQADKKIDVTAKLAEEIKNSEIYFKLTNEWVDGDPAPGVAKTLSIDYSYNGLKQQIYFNEGEYITLPYYLPMVDNRIRPNETHEF